MIVAFVGCGDEEKAADSGTLGPSTLNVEETVKIEPLSQDTPEAFKVKLVAGKKESANIMKYEIASRCAELDFRYFADPKIITFHDRPNEYVALGICLRNNRLRGLDVEFKRVVRLRRGGFGVRVKTRSGQNGLKRRETIVRVNGQRTQNMIELQYSVYRAVYVEKERLAIEVVRKGRRHLLTAINLKSQRMAILVDDVLDIPEFGDFPKEGRDLRSPRNRRVGKEGRSRGGNRRGKSPRQQREGLRMPL